METIALTQGERSIIDGVDRQWISEHRWYAVKQRKRRDCYAERKITISGKRAHIFLHQAVWEMHNGPIPAGMEIDHINGNGLDNRLRNLRLATRSQNMYNRRKLTTTSSKFKGVSYAKREGRWVAYIRQNRSRIHLGYFETELDAALAYDEKARELFGEFASLNFPPETLEAC
jgi:hypothetical protein